MKDERDIGSRIANHLLEEKGQVPDDSVLAEWLKTESGAIRLFGKYRKIWDGASRIGKAKRFNAEKAWTEVDGKIRRQTVRSRRIRNLAYAVSGMAASFLLFFSLTVFTDMFSFQLASVEMKTTYGSRSEIVLPDGSVVRLNAGSAIEYHTDKITKAREVRFKGEGFFEVAKGKKPFVVYTPGGLKVKVLGTTFNLSAYPDDQVTQTTLVEGKVELITSEEKQLTLYPGQIAEFDRESKSLKYMEGEPSHSYSWLVNKLYMENMSLKDVCVRLERWYDVQITFEQPELADNIHYTGVLKEVTIVDVLNALRNLSAIDYQLDGKQIVISKRNLPMK